jgi:hypothetical protein
VDKTVRSGIFTPLKKRGTEKNRKGTEKEEQKRGRESFLAGQIHQKVCRKNEVKDVSLSFHTIRR